MTAYDAISQYVDPGPFSITCARKSVVVDGKQIQYGGPLSGNIAATDRLKTITFDNPIKAEVSPGIHATITSIECTQTDAFALGTAGPFGMIAFRKKINLTFEDA